MILYEDQYIVAVNKPNNILVHHSKMANNRIGELSLVQMLYSEFGQKYFPIHRLDRKTSGIVLFAKQKEFILSFQKLFIENLIQKTYYGIVRGFTQEKGIIDSDVKGRDAQKYKSALTEFQTISQIESNIAVHPYKSSRYSLLKLTPKTGRLHQLRIHLNKISHPLIGDPKYGDRFHNAMFLKEFGLDNLFLHAKHINFFHPFSREEILITAKFPDTWNSVCEKFLWLKHLN